MENDNNMPDLENISIDNLINANIDFNEIPRIILKQICDKYNLYDELVEITISNTKLDTKNIKDYPLMVGKEILIKSYFKGCSGDAFTDKPTEYRGTIGNLIKNGSNPEIVATLNGILRYYNIAEKTIHCKGDTPEKCAKVLVDFLKIINPKKVGIIGFQPAFIKYVGENFNAVGSDLNPDNIGKVKYGVKIIDGKDNEKIIKECDIILATGSTIVNGTFWDIYKLAKRYNKRIIFYGTSISGLSEILGIERFCKYGL